MCTATCPIMLSRRVAGIVTEVPVGDAHRDVPEPAFGDGQSRSRVKTETGSSKPLASIAGAADQVRPLPAVRSRTTWVARTWPSPAASPSRAASWTAVCSESEHAGATIVEIVDSRTYGMRDFVVSDPDGHRFTLGRSEETLRDVADYHGLNADDITTNPEWLQKRA
jgi:hypothetical protein